MSYLLGIDLGTSSCKSVLYTERLQVVASAAVEYSTIYPHPGWAEQPAAQWWDALVETVRLLLAKAKIKPGEIAGIGVDSQGSVALPVDRSGEPLADGLLWMDRRSERQCRWIDRHLKDMLWRINGNYNDPSNTAPKILWFKENRSDIYQKTAQFLHANGYLVYRLTGEFSMDISEGGLTELFDTRRGCWSDDLITACGLDRNKLPGIYQSYDLVGQVTKEASAETGLMEGTPVVAGAMDMVASALGSGICQPGQVYVAGGTVTAVGICNDHPKFTNAFHVYHHIIPGRWINAAGVDFGGGSLRWFKKILEEENYEELNWLAANTPPGSNKIIFLPYMVGQRAPLWNSNTRGMIFGLNPFTTKGDLIRMFMEGNAYGVRYILEQAEAIGLNISLIRMTGGCTRSDIWSQIFADVTGKEIQMPGKIDVAALGSAITAGVGAGIFDFSAAMKMISLQKEYKTNQHNHRLYRQYYQIFKELYPSLKKQFDQLAAIQESSITAEERC